MDRGWLSHECYRGRSRVPPGGLEIECFEVGDELIHFFAVFLSNPDAHAHRLSTVEDEFAVAFEHCHFHCGFAGVAAEEFAEVNFEAPDFALGTGDGGGFVMWKDDGICRADTAAGGTAFLAAVLLFHEDAVECIDAVDTEQAEVDAFHAVGAAAVVDHGIPAAAGVFREEGFVFQRGGAAIKGAAGLQEPFGLQVTLQLVG